MTPRPTRIAVDAMGGDLGPEEIVRGVVQAARLRDGSTSFIIVGDEKVLREELDRQKSLPAGITIRNATQIIEMTDKPREVFRKKSDASVVVAARLVKDGEADGFISVGNTGACMAAAVFVLRQITGIDRPAIALALPSLNGPVVLVDAGANVDCEPRQLLEFAVMGQAYAKRVLGKASPTIGLLSNGEEATKGNLLTKETHALLREKMQGFTGNVEGRDVFRGTTDVVVCDGFDGNILLKVGEGVAEMVMQMVREELTRFKLMKLVLLPLRRGIRDLRGRIDYREFGGAPLLGVNGVCVIGHGRSDSRAVVNAIKVTEASINNNLVDEIRNVIAEVKSDKTAAT